MKHIVSTLFTLLTITFSLSAQIPERAEDISPLLIGEILPDLVLKAPDGSDQTVLNILSKKPTIIIFYRGGWCPYCNVHLAEMQGAESKIIKLGYQIVAISPDSPENLHLTDEKNDIQYSLYSDGDGKFMNALGIAFKAPERSNERLMKYSAGLNEGLLPVPSVFVMNTSGEIDFEYISPNYKTRISADLLLAVLKELTP